MRSDKYFWVTSGGGPFLILARELLHYWKGVPLDAGENVLSGDYGRACAIEGYFGIIDVGPGKALVLGDMPGDTTWLNRPEINGGIFVTWVGADNENSAIQAAQNVPESAWELYSENWIIETSDLVIFDSAISGKELRQMEELNFKLAPGSYAIDSCYRDEPNVIVILRRLRRAD